MKGLLYVKLLQASVERFTVHCPASSPFSQMGSGFPLLSGVYTLAEVTPRRREQQYIDDNLFNYKSRAAMMVNVAI